MTSNSSTNKEYAVSQKERARLKAVADDLEKKVFASAGCTPEVLDEYEEALGAWADQSVFLAELWQGQVVDQAAVVSTIEGREPGQPSREEKPGKLAQSTSVKS